MFILLLVLLSSIVVVVYVHGFVPNQPTFGIHPKQFYQSERPFTTFGSKRYNWLLVRKNTPTRCNFGTTSATTVPTDNKNNSTTRSSSMVVVFQKVVHPFQGLPDVLCLGYLVEYLQDHFEFPNQLPIVYEQESVLQESTGEIADPKHPPMDTNERGVVVRWDSPLSPDSSQSCLYVQVVGIFAQSTNDQNNIPNLAMVIVSKQSHYTNNFPPILIDLFASSERQILKALDRGLNDFMAGKIRNLGQTISTTTNPSTSQSTKQTYIEGQEAILGELLEENVEMESSKSIVESIPNDFIEADVILQSETNDTGIAKALKKNAPLIATRKQQQQQQTAALQSMNTTAPLERVESMNTTGMGLEYAVYAAKLAQAKRQKQQKHSHDDYAIQAAKTAAAKYVKSKSEAIPESTLSTESVQTKTISNPATDLNSLDLSNIPPPIFDPNVSGIRRSFMTSISKPKDYTVRKNARKAQATQASVPSKLNTMMETQYTDQSDASMPKTENYNNISSTNIEKSFNSSDKKEKVEKIRGGTNSKMNELIQAADDALTEMVEQGEEMSPDELLKSVMQFGEQLDREERVGNGFVTGAFEKAKDLLREQRVNHDMKLESRTQSSNGSFSSEPNVRDFTIEEDLRSMFEAGERIADGRITQIQSKPNQSTISKVAETTDADVDFLISQEKTISGHARVLDEELAELQIRINRLPGEELDGPAKNPLFDVLSGPEVYDRNVDPETAVNWPGAQRGTKSVRLPKELDVAVKQAKFAVEVLMNMKTTTATDGSTSYSFGDRDLSASQITSFQAVVEEAVEIGLIANPMEIHAEVARLQMLLDELWDQPVERSREIASNFKDLLLSDNFAQIVKQRMNQMADRDLDALRKDDTSLEAVHAKERALLTQLVMYAQLLVKETRALGARLESQQLEVIRSICKVAMDPSHQTEEDSAMALTDAVRDMRPLFDDCFVAYLKYAVAEEEGRLARAGVLDDPEHNRWLFVLKIVQQGVYTELARGLNRYVEHIWYILRMESPEERRMLLEKLVDVMPTLDVRPFVQVVDNIVGSLGQGASGEFDGVTVLAEMTNKLLQLHRDMKEVLPPDRVIEMSRDADEWAAKQKERLLKQRNLTRQRLTAAQDTEHLDSEVESFGKRGEIERFD